MNLADALAKSTCGIAVKFDTYKTPTGLSIKAMYSVDRQRRGMVRAMSSEKQYEFADYMRGGVAWMPWEEWIDSDAL